MAAKKPDLYLFCWGDAHHEFEYEPGCETMECFDVGFLVEETEEAVKIATQWSPEDSSHRFCTTLPAGMLKWRKKMPWSTRPPLDKRAEKE